MEHDVYDRLEHELREAIQCLPAHKTKKIIGMFEGAVVVVADDTDNHNVSSSLRRMVAVDVGYLNINLDTADWESRRRGAEFVPPSNMYLLSWSVTKNHRTPRHRLSKWPELSDVEWLLHRDMLCKNKAHVKTGPGGCVECKRAKARRLRPPKTGKRHKDGESYVPPFVLSVGNDTTCRFGHPVELYAVTRQTRSGGTMRQCLECHRLRTRGALRPDEWQVTHCSNMHPLVPGSYYLQEAKPTSKRKHPRVICVECAHLALLERAKHYAINNNL